MRKYFKVDVKENLGENWTIAFVGEEDGKEYIITTNNVRATRLEEIDRGAKGNGELIVKLLNSHYNELYSETYRSEESEL